MKKMRFLNTFVSNIKMSEALDEVKSYIVSNKQAYVVAVNVDCIMQIEKDSYFKKIVNNADMVLTDGMPLMWIAKLYRRPIKEKVSGSDLVPKLCEMATKNGYTIYILGGKDGIAQQAKRNLEALLPGIQVVGTCAPPIGFERDKAELEKIRMLIQEAKPDILLVCLGAPKQEKFIYENYKIYNAKVSVSAGATVDFLAGDIKRAPKWMSACGLEWFFRFMQEPKRLFKRYFVDDIQIIKLIWKYR